MGAESMHLDPAEPLGALARRALGFVKDDTAVGLGAGRATTAFVRALAARVRDRVVAAASRRQIILVERDKLVPRLGSRARLPVEVVPFALPLCRRRLAVLGPRPALRMAAERAFVTDNGNVILDCAVGPIADPPGLERAIRAIPGVVDTGLFLGTADTVLVAYGTSVSELTRQRGSP